MREIHQNKARACGRRLRVEPLEPRLVLDSTVVFNEIMYHPAGTDDTLEWIELHNQMAVDMDLSKWSAEGGIQYQFPTGTTLSGHGYLVVARDPVLFEATTGKTGSFGPFLGQLSNGGEELRLVNRNGRLMNVVDYGDDGDWAVGPDGSGFTLAKRNPMAASHLPENWTSSVQQGGTPGTVNFLLPEEQVTEVLIPPGSSARVQVPSDDSLGLSWTQDTFNDSDWTSGPTGVGYELESESVVAYGNLPGAEGYSTYGFSYGHDFIANSTITVTQLGVFDSGADGLSRTLTAELWSRNGNNPVKLAELEFTSDQPGNLVESNRFKALDPPLVISPGDYTIAAHGFGSGEPAGHQGYGGPGPQFKTLNDGQGAISFTDSRLGTSPGSFPTQVGTSSANYYSAGTFEFNLGATGDEIITDIESQMRLVNTTAYVRIPFTVSDTSRIQTMTLDMQYNDGFVAYINGQEVASHHAPAVRPWNAAALESGGGFSTQVIDLTTDISALQTGTNLLAVHGLNAELGDDRFLVLPQLSVLVGSSNETELAINEMAPGTVAGFFLEITNDSSTSQSVDGHVIATSSGAEYVLPSHNLSVGGHLSVTSAELGFTPEVGENLFLFQPGRVQLSDARKVTNRLRGRSADHDGRWLYPDMATPQTANSFSFHDEIVINEINYHPIEFYHDFTESTVKEIANGADVSILIPADGSLGTTWTGENEPFDDSTWIGGPTGVGFDTAVTGPALPVPIAYWTFDVFTNNGKTAPDERGFYDSIVRGATPTLGGQGKFGEALSFDGNNDYVQPGVISELVSPSAFSVSLWFRRAMDHMGVTNDTTNSVNNVLIAQSSSSSNDNLEIGTEGDAVEVYLDTVELGGPIPPVSQPASLQNDQWHHLVVSYDSNDVNELKLFVDGSLISESGNYGGLVADSGTSPFTIGLARPGFSSMGDFEGLIDDVAVWDEGLDAEHVSALFSGTRPLLPLGFTQLIGTDVENQLHDQGTSAYIRLPFEVDDPDSVLSLNLDMNYDDAFVAYINGTEVARNNVTGTPQWNSPADSDRPDADALQPESFQISNPSGLLRDGNNVLAIHGLTTETTDGDFLILPELSVTQRPQSQKQHEWLELYNRSNSVVDLTGWHLDDGITFHFPAGTMIQPGEFLVVAQDAAALVETNPSIANHIVGNYSGGLSNRDDRIELVDTAQNPADEVHYYDDGRWPMAADSGGSSLELRDPFADNFRSESWAASIESDDSRWRSYTYRGTALEPPGSNNPTLYNEFVLGLLDAGEILLDDLHVIEDPDGAAVERLPNGMFESDVLGAPPNAWQIIGNQHSEVIVDPVDEDNQVLRLTAIGSTEHMHNHAETTFVGATIVPGQEYEISFRAKWISGSNQVNTRLYFNKLTRTTIIEVPQLLGTPGAPNSQLKDNIGPTYSHFGHFPLVPSAADPVTISVRADDPDGISSMSMFYSVNGSSFFELPMMLETDGSYNATIPAFNSGRIVQFYVAGKDSLGGISMFPAEGPDSRALYRVAAGSVGNDDVGLLHLIMTNTDSNLMHLNTNVMSNDRLGATVISDDGSVFYDVGVRLRASGFGRTGARVGFNIRFHADQMFRGVHRTIVVDRGVVISSGHGVQGVPGASPHELLIDQISNRAGGIPAMYNDVVFLDAPRAANSGLGALKMARYGNDYLNSQFARGSDGSLFKYELVYYNKSSSPQSLKGSPNAVLGIDIKDLGDDKEAYRFNFILGNNRDRDDFQRIIDMGKAFSQSELQLDTATREVIDVDQWMRTMAMISLAGIGDVYNMNLPHNLQFYVHPEDNKVLVFPWDNDHSFHHSSTSPLLGRSNTSTTLGGPLATTNLSKIIDLPHNRRMFYGHLLDLINTSYNTTVLAPFIENYTRLTKFETLETFFNNYINNRVDFVLSELDNVAPQIPFEITTNSGEDFEASNTIVTIEGDGWIDVHEIRLAGSQLPLEVIWTDQDSWQVAMPVTFGANSMVLEAYNFQGTQIGSDSIAVTSTVSHPYLDFLRISEIHYHPTDPTLLELAAGFTDDGQFEFIELLNTSKDTALDLADVRITKGPSSVFNFDGSNVTSLGPGEIVLIVADQGAFAERYSGFNERIAGQYTGSLNNGGEEIEILDPTNTVIHRITYDDSTPWPVLADGGGGSLHLTPPTALGNHATHWTAGTPGPGEPDRLGDTDLDGDVDTGDLTRTIIHFTGAEGSGMTWSDGDTDGDEDVDTHDLTTAIIQFTGAAHQVSSLRAHTVHGIQHSAIEPHRVDISRSSSSAVNQQPTEPARRVSAESDRLTKVAQRNTRSESIITTLARHHRSCKRFAERGRFLRARDQGIDKNQRPDALFEETVNWLHLPFSLPHFKSLSEPERHPIDRIRCNFKM